MTSKEIVKEMLKMITAFGLHRSELTLKIRVADEWITLSQVKKEDVKQIEKDIDLLEQYKTIEKELGIDLITLCKTFEEDIYIKPDNKIIFVNYDKKEYRFYEGNINCNTDDGNFTVSIDDYGKTWALTREELENDK